MNEKRCDYDKRYSICCPSTNGPNRAPQRRCRRPCGCQCPRLPPEYLIGPLLEQRQAHLPLDADSELLKNTAIVGSTALGKLLDASTDIPAGATDIQITARRNKASPQNPYAEIMTITYTNADGVTKGSLRHFQIPQNIRDAMAEYGRILHGGINVQVRLRSRPRPPSSRK